MDKIDCTARALRSASPSLSLTDGERSQLGGEISYNERVVSCLDAENAHARLLEVAAVVLGVEADQIRAEHALQQTLAGGEHAVDLVLSSSAHKTRNQTRMEERE